MTKDKFEAEGVVSELSTWGYFIGDSEQIIKNV